jgi:hypothetical protein
MAAQDPILPKQKKIGVFKEILERVVPKRKSAVPSAPSVPAAPTAPSPSSSVAPALPKGSGIKKLPASIKLIGIVGFVLVVFLFALLPILKALTNRNSGSVVVPTPAATMVASPSATPASGGDIIRNPSLYANDPEVLQFSERLNGLDKAMADTVLREDELRVPLLDWKVTFK